MNYIYIRHNRKNIIALLAIISAVFFQVYVDMYLPSLPEVTSYFKASTLAVQLSLSLYFIGSSSSFLFYGVLSDIYGRRKLLITGLTISFLGTLVSLLSHSIYVFAGGRFLQGVGLGSTILGAPILIDLLKGKKLVNAFVYFNITYAAIPTLTPYIGGVILTFYTWHGIFIVLLISIFLVIISLVLFLPETLHEPNSSHSSSAIVKDFIKILFNKQFLGVSILISVSWGLIITFNVISPFLFQKIFDFSVYEYGIIALVLGSIYLLSTLSNRFLLKYFSPIFLIHISIVFAVVSSIIFLAITLLCFSSAYTSILFSLMQYFFCGLLFINGLSLSLALFPNNAGLTSAIQSVICTLIWGLISFIVAIFPNIQTNLACSYTVLSTINFFILYVYLKNSIIIPSYISN